MRLDCLTLICSSQTSVLYCQARKQFVTKHAAPAGRSHQRWMHNPVASAGCARLQALCTGSASLPEWPRFQFYLTSVHLMPTCHIKASCSLHGQQRTGRQPSSQLDQVWPWKTSGAGLQAERLLASVALSECHQEIQICTIRLSIAPRHRAAEQNRYSAHPQHIGGAHSAEALIPRVRLFPGKPGSSFLSL